MRSAVTGQAANDASPLASGGSAMSGLEAMGLSSTEGSQAVTVSKSLGRADRAGIASVNAADSRSAPASYVEGAGGTAFGLRPRRLVLTEPAGVSPQTRS
jgi:hypothetical protein